MAQTATDPKSNGNPEVSAYEEELRTEMADIRNALASLSKSLAGYGKARADDLQDSAAEWSDEVVAESRRAVKKLGKQLTRLEKDMEAKVRERPLQWFLGALGMGLVIAMLMRRNGD